MQALSKYLPFRNTIRNLEGTYIIVIVTETVDHHIEARMKLNTPFSLLEAALNPKPEGAKTPPNLCSYAPELLDSHTLYPETLLQSPPMPQSPKPFDRYKKPKHGQPEASKAAATTCRGRSEQPS